MCQMRVGTLIRRLGRSTAAALIRPGSLLLYWRLWGTCSPEVDLSGKGRNGTVSSTTVVNHAPVGPYRRR